jgi:DNA-directed RNA polymerase omega subunit
LDGLDIDSKFRLAILAAKRAKQLVNGAKKKVDMRAENPLTIAIEEINSGKINFHILEEDEIFVRKQDGYDEAPEEDEVDILQDLRNMVGPSDDDDEDEDDDDEEDDEDKDDDRDADSDDSYDDDDDHDYDLDGDDDFDDED